MGFCLLSNVAVVGDGARRRRASGCMILDYDAHHGNGTQAVFFDDPRVLFVSLHQWPLYPGTGAADEIGTGAGRGLHDEHADAAGRDRRRSTCRAFDEVIAPRAQRVRARRG